MAIPDDEVRGLAPRQTYNANVRTRVDQRLLAACVGTVAFALPIVLWIGAQISGPLRDSISHFYYEPFFGDVFVGAMVFIGAFAIAYRDLVGWELYFSKMAGAGAIGVGIFPTSGSGVETAATIAAKPLSYVMLETGDQGAIKETVTGALGGGSFFELFANIDFLHFGCASALFAFLAYCCLYVFPRPATGQSEADLSREKHIRNPVYYLCGVAILTCAVALLAKAFLLPETIETWWNGLNLTFWFESAALWFFGVSWLVKGRVFMKATFIMEEDEKRDMKVLRGSE